MASFKQMRTQLRLLTILLAINGLGCDKSVKQSIPTSSAPKLKSIASADYQSWKRFPVGTQVVRCKMMTNQHGKVVVTTKLQLKSIDATQAEVESQITVDRLTVDDKPTDLTVNPPSSLQFPASHLIPQEMSAEQFDLPTPDAKLLRKETIEVLGKSVEASVYQWKATLETGPVDVTGWFSDDFPGRQLKLEFGYTDETTSQEQIVSVEFPKASEQVD